MKAFQVLVDGTPVGQYDTKEGAEAGVRAEIYFGTNSNKISIKEVAEAEPQF